MCNRCRHTSFIYIYFSFESGERERGREKKMVEPIVCCVCVLVRVQYDILSLWFFSVHFDESKNMIRWCIQTYARQMNEAQKQRQRESHIEIDMNTMRKCIKESTWSALKKKTERKIRWLIDFSVHVVIGHLRSLARWFAHIDHYFPFVGCVIKARIYQLKQTHIVARELKRSN